MSIDTFNSILNDFAGRIGLAGLQIDPSGYCCLDVDHGTLVHLKHENKRDSMIIISEIGQIPEMNTGAVLRYLLRMNNNPEESKGMTLSYNAESNNAAIGYQYPLRFLDVTKFDTGNVTDMTYMFQDCSSLKKLDVNFPVNRISYFN